jgi:hypothetical protein
VAQALNEQGYLLQQKIAEVLQTPDGSGQFTHHWYVEAEEVPVSLPTGKETRMDLVLRHGPQLGNPWRVVLECKRSARDYKRWVFFGDLDRRRGPSRDSYYVELADLKGSWDHQGDPPMLHRVETVRASPDCQVFDYGVEAMINRPERKDKKVSATVAIEDAFQQVTLGQAGLAHRLRNAHELQFRLLPVVVTTADLVVAHFTTAKVSLDRGMIDSKHLKLEPKKWLAVNYRINDSICLWSGVTTNRTTDLAADLAARQVRTVFVVQAEHVQQFLVWLGVSFPNG